MYTNIKRSKERVLETKMPRLKNSNCWSGKLVCSISEHFLNKNSEISKVIFKNHFVDMKDSLRQFFNP